MNLLDNYYRYGVSILPILEEWRIKGLNVDVPKALLYKQILEKREEQIEKAIEKMVGIGFNPRSHVQTKDLYYKVWKLPPQYTKDQARKLTSGKGAREKLVHWIHQHGGRDGKHKQAYLYFDLIGSLGGVTKARELFDRISPDGRIHAFWKSWEAATFRLSSKPNVQNWTNKPVYPGLGSPRSVVIADDPSDSVQFSTDFSQIELWVYTWLFDIKYLKQAWDRKEYVYGMVYEDVLKEPFFKEGPRTKENKRDDVTLEKLGRAKAIPLGFQYGRKGAAIAEENGWPLSVGRKYEEAWFEKVPEVKEAHDSMSYRMHQKGLLRPPPGFLLHYPNPSKEKIRQGYAAYGQVPAFCILIDALLKMQEPLRELGGRTKLTVHDSIAGDIPRKYVRQACEEIIIPAMSAPVEWMKGFEPRFSLEIGDEWDWQMKDWKEWCDEQNN